MNTWKLHDVPGMCKTNVWVILGKNGQKSGYFVLKVGQFQVFIRLPVSWSPLIPSLSWKNSQPVHPVTWAPSNVYNLLTSLGTLPSQKWRWHLITVPITPRSTRPATTGIITAYILGKNNLWIGCPFSTNGCNKTMIV